jgi:hypothetical protein
MRTIRLDDFSLRENGVQIPWPEGAALRIDDFTFVDKDHKPIRENEATQKGEVPVQLPKKNTGSDSGNDSGSGLT